MSDQTEKEALQSGISDSNEDSTVDNSNPRRVRLYLCVVILNFMFVQCGAAFSWSSPVLLKLQLTDTEGSTVASTVPLASLLGPYISGLMINTVGHKRTAALGMTFMAVSWLLLALDTSFMRLVIGRFFGGVCVGLATALVPVYIAEISEDCVRGPLNTITMISVASGSLLVYAIGPYFSYETLNYTMLGTCVLFFMMFPLLPNSPYMLVMQNKMEQARDTLTWLRENRSPAFIERELQKIKKTVDDNREEKVSLKELFTVESNRRSLAICCFLMALQQFCGISVVLFYVEKIFLMTGAAISSSVCSIIFGVIMTLSSFICPVAVKYFGYKKPLLGSVSVMALGMGGLGLFFFLKFNHFDVGSLNWMPLVCVVLYIIAYCSGFASIPWALMGELFPSNVRPFATTLVTNACGLNTFITVNLFPYLVNIFGKDCMFFGFSFFSVMSVVYILLAVPETSGLSFAEIQEMMSGRKMEDLKPSHQEKTLHDSELKSC